MQGLISTILDLWPMAGLSLGFFFLGSGLGFFLGGLTWAELCKPGVTKRD
jgi:hypothetical protein